MRTGIKIVLALAWLQTTTACITVHDSPVIELDGELKAAPSKTLGVMPGTMVKADPSDTDLVIDASEEKRAEGMAQLLAALKKTHRFRDVKEVAKPGAGPDLTIQSRTTATLDNSLAWQFLTGLTLTLVPYRGTITLDTEWTVYDQRGRVAKRYKTHERVSGWIQLFLVFAMPFRDDAGVAVDQNQARYLANALAKDGLL